MFLPPALRSGFYFSVSLAVISFIGAIILTAAPVNGQGSKRVKSDYYPLAEPARPVALLGSAKNAVLINEGGIYQQEGKVFVKKYTSAAVVTCALADDSVFWLGTRQGLFRVNKKTFVGRLVPLPVVASNPGITTVLKDHTAAIWVGVEAYGVFKFTTHAFEKVLGAVPVNAGATTSDSAVWFGTNTGLHRWKNKKWVRYNEEGITNFEIPDNIVEKLQVDNNNNLWVGLSEGIAVLEAKPQAALKEEPAHIPSVKFIGKPQNAIYSVIYVNQRGYLFATSQGLLFLPNSNSGQLTALEQSQTTDVIADKQLLHAIQVPDNGNGALDFSHPVLLKADKRGNLWLVDRHGVRVLAVKNFSKLLPDK